jgi:hypothetical protein
MYGADESEFKTAGDGTSAIQGVAGNGHPSYCPIIAASRTLELPPHMTTDQPKRRSVEPIAVRAAQATDRPFIVEMARLACVIEDCPLPDPTAPEVEAMLPGPDDCALVATGEGEVAIGAAWWCFRDPALLLDESGAALPEMTLAYARHTVTAGSAGP